MSTTYWYHIALAHTYVENPHLTLSQKEKEQLREAVSAALEKIGEELPLPQRFDARKAAIDELARRPDSWRTKI